MSDILFATVEKFNGSREWGRFLDAGTGAHSLIWIQTLATTSVTAITADRQMSNNIERDPKVKLRKSDNLVVGNWMDDGFCAQLGKFDTILADYLIGAVDGFSPYEQDTILAKLRNHLNPGGMLYFIGMNPIPDHAPHPADIVGEVRRARDACILLAGHRPYREFPLSWVKRHLEQSHFTVLKSKNFTIMHSEDSVRRQIRVAQTKLTLMPGPPPLRAGMELYLSDLDERMVQAMQTAANRRIPLSFDYVLSACRDEDSFQGVFAGGSMAKDHSGGGGADCSGRVSPDAALMLEALQSLTDPEGDGDEMQVHSSAPPLPPPPVVMDRS